MKLALLFAFACIVVVASAQSRSSEADVAATLSKRWGHWTLERLRWKRAEIKSDLGQTGKEKARVATWGKRVCDLVRNVGKSRVAIAAEGVSEWTDILAIRRSQRGFHVGRQSGYDNRHVYITQGPLGRRRAANKAAWCKANAEACDRWRHERGLYFAHKFQVERTKHAAVTAHSRKRVANAKAALARAKAKLVAARKSRDAHNAACKKMFGNSIAIWKKRLANLKVRNTAVNAAIKTVKANRTKREATYKPFYMTKCRYIGGKHHMYYCYLDTNNASKAHHRFRVCKPRGPRAKVVSKLHFRCYK